jgi:repressor LexA
MKQSNMTPKEKEVYDFLCEKIRRYGYAPSVRDIKEALQIKSTATVHSYLARLEQKGFIQKESGKSRALRVDSATPQNHRTAHVPIIGRVTAGSPILAQENYEDYLDFPLFNASLLHSQLFALRVQGYSMRDAGILDNDIVVVSKTGYAENGDIVVALLEDEATVKRFYKEDGHFRLQPENPEFEPIITEDVYILGKVVSVVRFYDN